MYTACFNTWEVQQTIFHFFLYIINTFECSGARTMTAFCVVSVQPLHPCLHSSCLQRRICARRADLCARRTGGVGQAAECPCVSPYSTSLSSSWMHTRSRARAAPPLAPPGAFLPSFLLSCSFQILPLFLRLYRRRRSVLSRNTSSFNIKTWHNKID